MTAQPVEHDDPLDPMRILEDLPEEERPFFAAQYREHAEAARDPAGRLGLHRFLRRMRFHANEAAKPGYREDLEAALRPVGESDGMLLEDYVRMRRDA